MNVAFDVAGGMRVGKRVPFPLLVLGVLCLCLMRGAAVEALRETGFTAMWWVNGPAGDQWTKGAPQDPLLCLRSGELGVMIDTRRLRLVHAGRFGVPQARDAALAAGSGPVLELPGVDLELGVRIAGTNHFCTGRGPEPKDEFFQPVRFVETGRFFQRVVIGGLQFRSAGGTGAGFEGSLEITLWPDRLGLRLELPEGAVPGLESAPEGELFVAAAGKRVSAPLAQRRSPVLDLFGAEPGGPVVGIEADPALVVEQDVALGCHTIHLPEKAWSNTKGTYYPEEHLDRLDRWRLVLTNGSDREAVARLMFVQEQHLPITGFTPMLCDPDGTPSGLPVQISKNWHQRPEKGHIAHEGPWFHGSTVVRMGAKSRRELMFQMAYARYGGVPAASHAQLSLIGWGHNQFWEQAAIGSFGESICYEPGRVQRRCFIDDLRPLMTLPVAGGRPWGWAENCGGGDFLVWLDPAGNYRGFRGTRVDYRAQGPCRTDVHYLEETAGGEISARMEVSIARSDDYVRAFHKLSYKVLRPVAWKRLTFLQLGADHYNEVPAGRVAIGDSDGVVEEWRPARAQGAYDRRGMPLRGNQPWVSIHGLDRGSLGKGIAAASRGVVIRSWRGVLGGKPVRLPHLSTYCNEWGRGNFKTAIELGPPPDVKTLKPGDWLEAEVEIVTFPTDPEAYYGPNRLFQEALKKDADTWRLVWREAAANRFQPKARRGTITRNLPLVVRVDASGSARVDVREGVGWLPVTFTGLGQHRGQELRVNGQPLHQAIHGNDYWQTDYDPSNGTWSRTYNIPRDGSGSLHIEFGPAGTRMGEEKAVR